MTNFTYKAKKGLQETVEGNIDAANREDAMNRLMREGLFPVSITESAAADNAKVIKKQNKQVSRKISAKDILIFTQKLATLVRARVELLTCLRILYEQSENGRFRDVLYQVYASIKEGKSFSESLARFPEVFPGLFVNIIRAGEASGRIDYSLEQLSEFMSRQESLKSKIAVALAYPVLLIGVGSMSIFVMMNFVIPKLRPLFEGMGTELPLITKLILKLSSFSSSNWLWVIGIFSVILLLLYRLGGRGFFKSLFLTLRLRLPIIKKLSKGQELAHLSRSLSLLLKSGVPALKSLEIVYPAMEDPLLMAQMKLVCSRVASGQGLAQSMESETNLPRFFTKMIAVGEESGRLTEVLEEISRSYTQQLEADISMVTSLLEPVLILVLGLILGTIVLAILLPTFQVTQMVH